MRWRRGKLTPEETAAMVERKVNHVLSHVDATGEQKAKVTAIAKAAVADLAKLGFTPGEGRSKFLQLFRADKVEPEAIEALRARAKHKMGRGDKAYRASGRRGGPGADARAAAGTD